jgi:predicted ester cyclase
MSITENKAFIARYFEAISGKDKPLSVVNRYVADSDQELKNHIAFFEASFPQYELIADEMLAEGNKVTVRARFIGTHKGELMGIPPTGKTTEIEIALIYEVENGKIVNHWMLADQMSLMQQLGVIPQQA